MCIAIYKPKGKVLSQDTLKECYNFNPDGAGFMYAQDKKLHIEKGFFSYDSFYQAYQKHETKQTVIHFRIKTHGKIDTTNCHPFAINNSIGFVHNGIISGFGDTNHSDTFGFNNEILQPLVHKWGNLALFQDPIINLIEGRIGFSKLVFLDRHGNHKIMNESKGEWDDGVWYSNNSYKPYVAPVSLYPWNNTDWIYDYYKKPVLKIKTKTEVKIGDMVELLEDIHDLGTRSVYETGEICEVVAVNQNFTCDLMIEFDDKTNENKFIYNVPYHSLDFIDDFEDDDKYLEYPVDTVEIPAYQKYPSPYILKGKTK